jgi:hypothetical protein
MTDQTVAQNELASPIPTEVVLEPSPIPTEVRLEPAPPPVFPGEGATDHPRRAPAGGSPLGDYTRELQQEFEEQEDVGKV